jgi:hypothetical protein
LSKAKAGHAGIPLFAFGSPKLFSDVAYVNASALL